MATPEINLPDRQKSIGAEEAKYHIQYIELAINELNTEKRKQILLDGFLTFGRRFITSISHLSDIEDKKEWVFKELWEQSQEVFLSFLAGKELTDRADEAERRAYIATEILKETNEFHRIAALALLSLPEGHPMRDIKQIKQSLSNALQEKIKANGYDDQLLIIKELFRCPLNKNEYIELIKKGNAIIPFITDRSIIYYYYVGVISYYTDNILSEDQETVEDKKYYVDKASELIQWMSQSYPDEFAKPAGMNLYAAVMGLCDMDEIAAQNFEKTVNNTKPNEATYQTAAIIESRYRMDFNQYERIIQILTPVIPYLEENYLLAVEEKVLEESGASYYDAIWNLAFAHANLENWNEAFEFLERGKSRRLLYQGAIRRSKKGQQLLKWEKKLYMTSRKIEFEDIKSKKAKQKDWFNEKLSLKIRILEEYRRQRNSLAIDLTNPSLEKITPILEDDEAVLTIGLTKEGGTFLILLCKDDREKPSGTFIDKAMNFKVWAPLFAGENQDGWLYALGAPEADIEHKSALTFVLKGVDTLIGEPLKKILEKKNIKRLTIIPQNWLHAIPFWALSSFEDYEVTISASAAHFILSRQNLSKANRNALIVSNPTLDLPCSNLEASVVNEYLSVASYKVISIERETATEKNVVKALSKASIFHFCGHGRSNMDDPAKSFLMMATDLLDSNINQGDPFEPLLSQVGEWKELEEDSRGATVPEIGYMYEKRATNGVVLERILEMGESTSLLGLYSNGQLTNVVEMWSAGDIMTQRSLSKCSLAFLSACEMGVGSHSFEIEEYAGLPAALQLAGVKTVICSLWPVEDVLTALYVDFFYKEFSQMKGIINVAALVKKINNKLRLMKIEEAVFLLTNLTGKTQDKEIRKDIEYYISDLLSIGEMYPFSHPIHWASFYVTGASHISFLD